MSLPSVESLREEVREIQLENAKRNLTHLPAEVHSEVAGTTTTGKTDRAIEVDAFGGYLYIDTHGAARLDEDAALSLRKQLDKAIQTGLTRTSPSPEDDEGKSVWDQVG